MEILSLYILVFRTRLGRVREFAHSTKLFLLCGMFVGAIILATYSLVEEKQIAIGFVRKELIGARYMSRTSP